MKRQRTWVWVSWMAGALLPLAVGITGAANTSSTPPQTNQRHQQCQQVACAPARAAQFQPSLERARNLIGAKIVNDKGERLGKVEDIVLTPSRDAISYVVLAHNSGTWGVGDKYFAVPWSQFQVGPGEKFLFLNRISKADVDRAPGFDKNHWPAMASTSWLGIALSSGMTPSGRTSMPASSQQRMAAAPESRAYTGVPTTNIQQLRLSKVFGTSVRNLQGENLGKLDNVMIDVNQGKPAYGIMAIRDGFLGMNKDFAAVPWTALNWTSQPGVAQLNTNRQTLTAIAFGRNSFPNLADPQYSQQLYERFHATPYWQSLGFLPGADQQNGSLPSSEMTPPNAAAPEMPAHTYRHALSYNLSSVETIHGTVKSVGTYRIEGTSMPGVRLNVRTDEGRMLKVQVGPRSFLDGQKIGFRAGDPVTITGSVVKTGRREAVLASQIKTPNRTLELRAPDGKPLWNLDQYRGSTSASTGFGDRNPYDW